jgi:glyoxylase-like metal-dependent hydrolase (beta-lactamase superfamily II)
MRKLALLGIALLTISLAFAQHDTDYSKVQIKVNKVAGTVYMLEGAGGNIGASLGEDGIVIVDDQYAPLAEKIQAALKGVTDKPIRFIINTHYHEDHVGGNEYFQKQAPIIAHDNVRKRLAEGGTAGNLGSMKFEAKAPTQGSAADSHLRSRRYHSPQRRRHPRPALPERPYRR